MKKTFPISADRLTLDTIEEILDQGMAVMLSVDAEKRIRQSRDFLVNTLETSDETFYGINTGFGDLWKVKIDKSNVEALQHNLVVSHACGMGEKVPIDVARLMLLLKIQNFAYGFSGVRVDLVNTLADMYNKGITPVIYEQGSLGASGDLAPLAHMSLPIIGFGQVYYEGDISDSKAAFQAAGIQSLSLRAKEGLALLNGTQFMTAYGVHMLLRARRLINIASHVAALSVDAFDCLSSPFDPLIHGIRHHKGQQEIAAKVLQLLEGSEIACAEKKQVQDPYSFRCIPQVHGASLDVFRYAEQVFENEISSVTDNPNIFASEGEILSGGNFHGQPLALTLDMLAIALAELGAISERRIFKLLGGQRGLPPFLVKEPGLNSGFMIPQYTAASIASQNKQLCTPASVDNIDSSNGQEDHVSMGANAATKCYKVLENVQKILAIELMAGAQALAFRRPMKTSSQLEEFVREYRKKVSFADSDRPFYADMQASVQFINEW